MITGSQAFFSAAAPRSNRASWSGVSRLVRSAANVTIIPIEPMLRDVSLHRGRQAVAYRLALRERLAELAARDVRRSAEAQHGAVGIQARSPEAGGCRRLRSRPADHHDRSFSPDQVGFVPGRELSRRVPAEDQKQLVGRMLSLQLADR